MSGSEPECPHATGMLTRLSPSGALGPGRPRHFWNGRRPCTRRGAGGLPEPWLEPALLGGGAEVFGTVCGQSEAQGAGLVKTEQHSAPSVGRESARRRSRGLTLPARTDLGGGQPRGAERGVRGGRGAGLGSGSVDFGKNAT